MIRLELDPINYSFLFGMVLAIYIINAFSSIANKSVTFARGGIS